jgi:hypothetical protein
LVGAIGYFITWLVPRVIGIQQYASFAVFWASIFLVAAALSGIQQEITRATRVVEVADPTRAHTSRNFSFIAAGICALLVAGSSPFWAGAVFGSAWLLVLPLTIGCATYVLQATIGGTAYSVAWWPGVFVLIITEGVLRLILVSATLLIAPTVFALAWAVVAPFLLTAVCMWALLRRRVRNRITLDVSAQQLTWNVLRTVIAAASMGILVSGFPLMLQLTSRGESATQLGTVILTATLTRAPLIVVGMALQSYFVLLFRTHIGSFGRLLGLLLGGLGFLGLTLTIAAYFLGPPILQFLFPGVAMPAPWFIAGLVATSCLIGALCIAAPAVLAKRAHTIFGLGWLTAAAGTILVLLLPGPVFERTITALFAGPSAGLLVYVVYLISTRTRVRSPGPSAF